MEDSNNTVCDIPQQVLCERRLSTIEQHLKDNDKNIAEKLDQILAQTQKTNGRVSKLEEWRAVIKSNMTLIGALVASIVSTTISVLISLIDR